MRSSYTSIAYGFLSVISEIKNKELKEIVWNYFKKGFSAEKVKVYSTDQIESELNEFIDIAKRDQNPNKIMEDVIEEMIQNLPNEVITLIVDEENISFTIDNETSQEKIDRVEATLNLFTKLTKQSNKVGREYIK